MSEDAGNHEPEHRTAAERAAERVSAAAGGVPGAAVQTGAVVVRAGTVVVTRALTLYPLRLLVPTVAFAVTMIVVVGAGLSGDLRFYQAAATIIVVLVLNLSTQARFFVLSALPEPPPWIRRWGPRVSLVWVLSERFSAVALLGYLAVGEFSALYAIANVSADPWLLGLCSGAIASGFFAIGTLALLGEQADAVSRPAPPPDAISPPATQPDR